MAPPKFASPPNVAPRTASPAASTPSPTRVLPPPARPRARAHTRKLAAHACGADPAPAVRVLEAHLPDRAGRTDAAAAVDVGLVAVLHVVGAGELADLPRQMSLTQSLPSLHVSPAWHGGHIGPPQSTSVSSPSWTPSWHVAARTSRRRTSSSCSRRRSGSACRRRTAGSPAAAVDPRLARSP